MFADIFMQLNRIVLLRMSRLMHLRFYMERGMIGMSV